MITYPKMMNQVQPGIIDLTIVNDCCSDRLLYDEKARFEGHAAMDQESYEGSYYHGYRKPRYAVPAVRSFFVPNYFEFYVQRGFVNAMFDAATERDNYAISINRR